MDSMNIERIINKSYKNTSGIVVLKNNEKVYEQYFNNCHENSYIHVYSVTKSVLSILIGIALDKGFIQSLDQKVLDFFPDYVVSKKETTIQTITIKDIMTMSAPYKYLIPPYIKYFTSADYVKFSLDLLGGKKKSGKFRYTPLIGPDILSGILMRATNQTVLDFAKEHLFNPLQIQVKDNLVFKNKDEQMAFNKSTSMSGWSMDSKGVNTAGWGLTLTANDMAKIGQLYLNSGIWNGEHIVSKKWIEDSTKEHQLWKKMNLPYGYLWWVIDEKDGIYAAMGDGGNIIYVNTKQQLVVAIACLFVPKAKDRIDFIKNVIEPMFLN